MKKIFAVSIMAVMAVTAANANIASKQYVDDQVGSVSALVGESSVATQIANAIDQTYDATSTHAQSGTAVAGAIATISGTANSALQTVTANDAAGVVTNIAKDGTAVTMTKAKVTGADIADDAGIAATQLASGVQTTLTNAAADHTTIGGYGDIVTHNASEFATAASLGGLATKDSVGTSEIDANAVTLGKLSASLPNDCTATGAECVLKSSSGALAWEVIQRGTNGQ